MDDGYVDDRLEQLKKYLSVDGIVSSDKRWWSGSHGFDFKVDAGNSGPAAVTELEPTEKSATVNTQELAEQRQEVENRVNRLLDELIMPLKYDEPAKTDIEAIQRALNFILTIALDEDNFTSFGSDIFQTFYDISTTAEEPLRTFALLRTEVAAQMWLQTYPSFGASSSTSETPSPDEILDFVMGIYTLERVGIGHDSKELVREAAKKNSIENFFEVDESAFSMRHRHTKQTMEWRVYTKALTYTFFASKVGVDIYVDLVTVLRLLPLYRPYKQFTKVSKSNDTFDEYADQLTMLFNLIHVLSNYGELRIAPSLLPQEYAYLSDERHLDIAISFSDVHLVGEIIHCLRVLGKSETDPLMVKGLSYLRSTQKLDGSWPTRDDAEDDHPKYHAVMCAVSALSPQRFRGFGPGATDALYSVLIATRHDTLLSVASQGIRPIPSLGSSSSEENALHEVDREAESLNYGGSSLNDAVVDKSKDLYGHPSFINERLPPMSQFSGIKSLYNASADYAKAEVNLPAAVYGASRLRSLLATKQTTSKRKNYMEPAGVRHSKKRKASSKYLDENYKE